VVVVEDDDAVRDAVRRALDDPVRRQQHATGKAPLVVALVVGGLCRHDRATRPPSVPLFPSRFILSVALLAQQP
jgi:hypothetical protein